MKKSLMCIAAFTVFLMFAAEACADLTMTLQSQSHIRFYADFGGNSLIPQDGTSGTVDYNASMASDDTTFQGTITVQLDNLLAPTQIKIVTSDVSADLSGQWLPKVNPTVNDYTPAADADYGLKLRSGSTDFAYGAARDIAYDISTADVESINASGEFNSTSQAFTFISGAFDLWYNIPFVGSDGYRDDLTGTADYNQTENGDILTNPPETPDGSLSTFVVENNIATLTIPVHILNTADGDLSTYRKGVLVATAAVPEPGTWILMGLGMIGLFVFSRRKSGK